MKYRLQTIQLLTRPLALVPPSQLANRIPHVRFFSAEKLCGPIEVDELGSFLCQIIVQTNHSLVVPRVVSSLRFDAKHSRNLRLVEAVVATSCIPERGYPSPLSTETFGVRNRGHCQTHHVHVNVRRGV